MPVHFFKGKYVKNKRKTPSVRKCRELIKIKYATVYKILVDKKMH